MVVKLVIFCLKLQINKIKFTYFLFEMLKCIFEINEIDEIFKKKNFFRSLRLKKKNFLRARIIILVGRLKRGKSRDFRNFCFFQITFLLYIYNLFSYKCYCILPCSASLLRVQSEVLNVVFDLLDFLFSFYPFLEMISRFYSLLCKVKNYIQNSLFLLSKLV